MSHLLAFGLEVFFVVGIGFDPDGELFCDGEAVAFEADDFARVIGEEPDGFEAEVGEDLGSESVLTQVHAEAEGAVGFDRIEALFLEFVGLDFWA
ncbi:MAG: hypothetical protein RI897_2693 [Verrucomicrobiota bacterium]